MAKLIKKSESHKFSARLGRKALKKKFPHRAMLEITWRCNLKCRHCYVAGHNSRKRELTIRQVYYIIDRLEEAGCFFMGITGGEPFMRKDILKIIEYARNKGIQVIVLTNATLITPKIADRLRDIGLNKVDVSFHSIKEEAFDNFTQVKGSYQRCLNGIKLLRERNIGVYMKVCAMDWNLSEIKKIRHFAVKKMGAHFRYDPYLLPRTDGSKEPLSMRISPKDAIRLARSLQSRERVSRDIKPEDYENEKKYKKKRKRRNFRKGGVLFNCGAGRTEVIIDPYGNMKLCLDIDEPKFNIFKDGFDYGWKKLVEFRDNVKPSDKYKCWDCEFTEYCSWCPARGWLEGHDLSVCDPYFKERARLEKIEAERWLRRQKLKN